MLPTLTVQVAFTTDPYDVVPTWSEIQRDVRRITIQRGRSHELNRIEAGVATIELDNMQGNYWPKNVAGLYTPNVKPGKRINIRGHYNAVDYDLYTGYCEDWTPRWLSKSGGLIPLMELTSSDITANLARVEINNAGYAAELSGTRVDNVLDYLSANIGRDLDAGQSTMQATGALVEANVMEHLFLLQKSELGIIYSAGDGDVQFEDRHHRLLHHQVSLATFGDDLGENHYHGMEPKFGDDYIYNDIRITREGGTQQATSDATSQTDYGIRSLSFTGLLMTTDNEANDQANYLIKRYKDPALAPRKLEVIGERDPAALWPKLLGYEISDRITLRRNEADIDEDYYIEGISHNIDRVNGTWDVQWDLSDAENQAYWILGVAGFSELGTTTWLGY